jgi:hypothetical protein
MSSPTSSLRRWLLRLLFLFLLCAVFASGFSLAWYCVVMDVTRRLENLDKSLRELSQGIYGTNYFHLPGVDAEGKARLAAFDPSRGSNTLKLSNNSVWGDSSLSLQGDGTLISETKKGGKRTLGVIAPDRCKAVFHKVLTSGLLNFSEEVIQLKERLDEKLGPWRGRKMVDDGSSVKISITVPELEVNKEISVYVPEVALENHPDIIEFKLLIELEKEIASLVPAGDPEWSR